MAVAKTANCAFAIDYVEAMATTGVWTELRELQGKTRWWCECGPPWL
jgi:hypothetical protein